MNRALRTFSFLIAVPLLISTGIGCSNTDSENVTTEGMRAEITVSATGNGNTGVSVDLGVGSGGIFSTGVELSSGDTLTATDGTTTRTLVKEGSIIGSISYETTFQTDTEDTQFIVALIRNSGENAENSTATLPAPFNLSAASDTITGDGSQTVDLEWTNSHKSDPLSIDVDCTCNKTVDGQTSKTLIYEEIDSVTDDGNASYSIQYLLDVADPTQYDLGCTIDLTMKRTRSGSLDPAFGEGGFIKAVQARTLSIRYNP